jgi:hypothetical protein
MREEKKKEKKNLSKQHPNASRIHHFIALGSRPKYQQKKTS